jgi:hypothetical protein
MQAGALTSWWMLCLQMSIDDVQQLMDDSAEAKEYLVSSWRELRTSSSL